MTSKLFKVLPVAALILCFSAPAFAQDGHAGGGGMVAVGIGLALGLSILGAGLGQGRIGGSAMEGMARNPQASGDIRTAMLLALAFPEALVILTWVLGLQLMGKI